MVDGILNQLQTIADDSLDKKSLPIFRGCLDEVLKEGLRRKFQSSVLEKIYLLFCKVFDRLSIAYIACEARARNEIIFNCRFSHTLTRKAMLYTK